MMPLQAVLCSDGPSDAMLTPILQWTLRQHLGPHHPIAPIAVIAHASLRLRLEAAVQRHPDADLLVVHRDAEEASATIHAQRTAEVRHAVAEVVASLSRLPPHVCVVPVRMSEAWLLFDAGAIRTAAGRPRGKLDLGLPRRGHDTLPDPKRVLREAVIRASELSGRQLARLLRDYRPLWVAEYIDDFSPLRKLKAFELFESELAEFAASLLKSRDTVEEH